MTKRKDSGLRECAGGKDCLGKLVNKGSDTKRLSKMLVLYQRTSTAMQDALISVLKAR